MSVVVNTNSKKGGKKVKKSGNRIIIENTGKRTRQNKVQKSPVKQVQTTNGKTVNISVIPHCSAEYGNALCNPFDTPGGPCIPYGNFPYRSQKVKVFCRSRFALGTTGQGYASCVPVSTNDTGCVAITASNSVGTAATLFSAYTNLSTLFVTQIPYTAAQVTASQVQARVVAAGLRVKYVGALASRNGTVVGYEDPDHRNAQTLYSFDTLASNPYSMMDRIGSDHWDMTVCYSGPSDPAHVEFLNSATPLNNTQFMMIAISGAAGDVYEVEYYSHLEYIGLLATAKTDSHVDPNYGQLQQAAKAVSSDKPLSPASLPTFWDKVKAGIAEVTPMAVQVGSAIYNALKSNPSSTIGRGVPMSGMLGMAQNALMLTMPQGLGGNRPPGNPFLQGIPRTRMISASAANRQRDNEVDLY
jgi:hypothetical protein